ncbi:MAG: hypothetical protein ABIN48_04480 [Ginsengibacter sp.]
MRLNNFQFKYFLLFILFFAATLKMNAQKKPDDYNTHWKKIEEFKKKGLPKSALAEIDIVYKKAKKSSNNPQIIKALLFRIPLQQNLEEEANEKSISDLESEIQTQKGVAKAILQSISAQMYWNYFQANRYKLYSRTNTENFDKKDIATWTIDDFHQKISELYEASIKDETLLKKTSLQSYEPIIQKGNSRQLRPTLFDLLAHRALEYFKNDERDITRPAYAFEIDDLKMFAPANEFVNHSFKTKDSTSLHFKALTIFKKLVNFHLKDSKPDALIDADI